MMQLSDRRKWLLIFIFSLMVQLLYLADSYDDPTFYRPIIDANTYHEVALQIVAGNYHPKTPYYQPPLFPYILSFLYRFSGNSILVAKVALAIVGALTSLLAYLVGVRLFSARTAFVAAIMVALYGPLVFFNSRLLPAGTAAMLNMLLLWLLLKARRTDTTFAWLSAGLCLGVSAICVPSILLFSPAIPVWLFVGNNDRFRSVVTSTLLICLGAALAIAPVTVSNYLNSGQFCLISYNGGLNFYIGNNLNSEQTIAIRPGFAWENLTTMPTRNGVHTATDQNRFYYKRAIAYIVENPMHFTRSLGHKLREITNARELPRNVDIYVFRQYSLLLSALIWRIGSIGFPFGVIFPLACLGMIIGLRSSREHLLPILFVSIYAFFIALFFVSARYRVVFAPILCIYAAHSVNELWRLRHVARSFPEWIFFVGFVAVLTNFPVTSATDKISFEAEMYKFLALQADNRGLPDQAERELEHALAIAPDYAEGYHSLGLVRLGQDRLKEAKISFKHALELRNDYAEAWNNLGRTEERLGDIAEAERAYRQALNASPEIARLHKDLGKLYFHQGRIAEALPLLYQAVYLNIGEYEAYGLMAWIMATSPDVEFRNGKQALIWARFLISAQGETNPMWTETLAAALAELGNFDEAVTAEKRAIELWRKQGRDDVVEAALQRLATYRQHEPFRDPGMKNKSPISITPKQ
jgi:tetratricopeptide (TPR) repeat protein